MTTRPRVVGPVALGLAASLALSACADPVPSPSPESAQSTAPVLTSDQREVVLKDVGEVLESAAKELDAAQLGQRLSGPALDIRRSELEVAKRAKTDEYVTVIPTEVEGVVVPTTPQWPRTMLAVSVQPELQTQRLLVLQQSSARANYKLWGWVKLFPGGELKSFANEQTGSPEVAPDAQGLLMTPEKAVKAYSDVLNKGKKSKFADAFEVDPFREAISRNNKLQNEALKAADGKQTMTFTPVSNSVYALGSVEGGALVVGELNAVEDRRAEKGAQLSPATPVEKALGKKAKIKNQMTLSYTTMVAIYVPPAGSTDAVTVVGVDHVATSVEAS